MFTKQITSQIGSIKNRLQISNKYVVFTLKYLFIGIALITIVFALLASFNYLSYKDSFYPDTVLANIDISGLNQTQAQDILSKKIQKPDSLQLVADDTKYDISLSEIGLAYNFESSVKNAFVKSHEANTLQEVKNILYGKKISNAYNLDFNYDKTKLDEYISVIYGEISVKPIKPTVKIVDSQVAVDRGKSGREINKDKLSIQIVDSLAKADFSSIKIPIVQIPAEISESEASFLKTNAEKLLGKTLILTAEEKEFVYTDEQLFAFLNPQQTFDDENITSAVSTIGLQVEREPQNPLFIFSEDKVREFSPAKEGLKIKKDETLIAIKNKLTTLLTTDEKKETMEISLYKSPPKVTTDQVNNLGIKELIGRGTSKFSGSIPSRIHNIALASSILNGVLVPPGETFSFNNSLGDVSAYTGYQKAYVIKDGKTVLGDGGGVCQVSTTLFRAVLASGLPIIERRAHAYRVYYYEQDSSPGLDATVYSPTTDFKFRNDTPGHLLIQTKVDEKNKSLAFEIYGTSDGRVSNVTKPVIASSTPPPDDLYTDDPTFPTGVVKQVEHKAWGAKVTFNYSVERAGETIYQKTFISNYQPWQAVYLRGTGPVN